MSTPRSAPRIAQQHTHVLCYAMPCYAMLCYAMLCCAVLCMPCHAMPCHAMLRYATLRYAMLGAQPMQLARRQADELLRMA